MSDRILFFSASRLSLLLASPTLAAYSNWIQAKQSRNWILTKTTLSTLLAFPQISRYVLEYFEISEI